MTPGSQCQEFGDESLHPGDLKPSLAKAMNEAGEMGTWGMLQVPWALM